ncbi:hypothetical protein GGQ80_000550 [Sphingomonas jinjuensis]|uniref:Uncharacterized protein n=1 Tax=Sphingomonas jinjuensis TaxID=535907 RepID=A0A840FA70_9SPHN|nr:hypothetical protein [Sphingomonas jinjuensis]MBB4152674.1 hypothetical protein [Sphingomonas jinjuensis]
MNETVIGLSLLAGAATLLPVGGAVWWWRRGRQGRIETAEEAADAAEAALHGFAVTGAVVGADGAGALAVANDGRVAVMTRRGKRIAVAEVAWSMLRSAPGGVVVELRDRAIAIVGVNALDIRRVAGASVRVPLRD